MSLLHRRHLIAAALGWPLLRKANAAEAPAAITVATAGASAARPRDVLETPALLSPLAPRQLLNGLALAGRRVVAVGQRGHVLLSDDAGARWRQAPVPVSSDLVAVHFADARLGWAVGHDGVLLHSADGGETWQRQHDGRSAGPQGTETPLLDVCFRDGRSGYAIGAFGLMLRTDDGGAHWTPAPEAIDNPKNLHLYALRSAGDTLLAVGEQGLALKLDAAAQRWRALQLPYGGTLFGLLAAGRSVLAFGLRGTVLRSTDGGQQWQTIPTGLSVGLTAGTVLADGRIVLASQAGHLIASRDEGASFAPLVTTGDRPLPAAALIEAAPGTLVLAGPRGVQSLPLRS
ncbi:WD40/YVTN/BNR-like repeat-containing protein [Aquabacterium sp.]|uniref:WD40/YVTN/BNR-like repeat-containing protein n=1 Tax=Aquabacterium sp. TaxID=1872578 RepID=UPI0037832478